MPVTKLDNSAWGFESNCFVCEPRNQRGLQVPFEHDSDADVVRAVFTLDDAYSGAPTYVHGGVVLALMDEAMSWATIAIGKSFAVTRTATTNFLRPVRVGRQYTVEARIDLASEGGFDVSSVVFDDRGPCTEAKAIFVSLSADQATSALGTKPTGEAAKYVKDD